MSSVARSRLTLCNLMDCSPPGSSVHGILQARGLEWVPCPPLGDLPNPGIESGSPAMQADSLLSEPPEKPSPSRATTQTSISKSRLQDFPPPLCIPHQSPSNPQSFAQVAAPVFSQHLHQPKAGPGQSSPQTSTYHRCIRCPGVKTHRPFFSFL